MAVSRLSDHTRANAAQIHLLLRQENESNVEQGRRKQTVSSEATAAQLWRYMRQADHVVDHVLAAARAGGRPAGRGPRMQTQVSAVMSPGTVSAV